VQSNCVAVLPLETPLGRKRRIDQSSCNKDYSCAKGFCPSFVSVSGVTLRKKSGTLIDPAGRADFERRVAALPLPPAHVWTGPYDLLVTGVGGTGIVTVGAVIAMAAHLEGKAASVLDFMGFAQKGGSVLSFVRWADKAERLNQVRIDTQQADAILACDLVVGASPEALQTVRRGRTKILANIHEVPVAESLSNPDASLKLPALLEKLRFAAGAEPVETFDAQTLAEDFLGDTIVANILALGYAWQRGLVPVGLPALHRAIELNNVAVPANLQAFALGRLAAGDPPACAALREGVAAVPAADDSLPGWLARGVAQLTAYQDSEYAERFVSTVRRVQAAEQALGGAEADLPLTRTVARCLFKLMAIKDEYEVARLYTDGRFAQALAEQFDGRPRLAFHFAPPLLMRPRGGQPPRKLRLGAWMWPLLRLLARGRRLRGTMLDVFGRTEERRMERALLAGYEARLAELLPQLTPDKHARIREWAALPLSMRGFGHVKAANIALARAREAELLHRIDPTRYPRLPGPATAGQLKGIAVVSR
jgi:indolepyruvate ferredoxin oxidoreductase